MDPTELKRRLRFGIQRSRDDGAWTWNQDITSRMIWLPDSKPTLSDPTVQQIFRELQEEGEIELVGGKDLYIQILKRP